MRVLFLFLDGVGLGDADPLHNAFAAAHLPVLTGFTRGARWLRGLERSANGRGTFIPTDACLGVSGRPQSATGQATIMTGLNVPHIIGRHYGPKPNPVIAGIIARGSIIKMMAEHGLSVGFVNAFPPDFFKAINRGRRLLSSNQLALDVAGVNLPGVEEIVSGQAMSADFTGQGWRSDLGFVDTPVMTPQEAGRKLATLAQAFDFTFFDHWVTDYVGHRGTLQDATYRLEVLDGVVAGLLEAWDDSQGLIVMTSDHGNIEDLGRRGHTTNLVPTLVIGSGHAAFAEGLTSLVDLAPRVLTAFGITQ